jgi:hypothetical protein
VRTFSVRQRLLDESRLPDLARTRHDLQEAPRLRQAGGENGRVLAPEGDVGQRGAHDSE